MNALIGAFIFFLANWSVPKEAKVAIDDRPD